MNVSRCTDHRLYSDIHALQTILPAQYKHTVCEFTEIGHDGGFSTVLRLNLTTEAEARQWLTSFHEASKNTFRVASVDTGQGVHKKNIFKLILRCHHNTLPRSATADTRAGSKNTNCPASMTITVKRVITIRRSRSSDIHANKMPMIVKLQYNHNHPIDRADVLKHRDVSDAVTEKFVTLFQSGHSPSTALNVHKYDLQEQYTDNFVAVSADRSKCPDKAWCYRLYYKTIKKNCGKARGESVLQDLEKKVSTYNSDELTAGLARAGDNICIALCTPLMKRVHRLVQQSGELVCLDSCGGVDSRGWKVFLMLTQTLAGSLPLGLLVTTSDAEEVVMEGLMLLKGLFPNEAFFNRGEEGPVAFMSDDSESERKAVKHVFPRAHLLLSILHIIQATWRFLWDSKHQISNEHRSHLLNVVKRMLYAETADKMEEHYVNLLNDATVKMYPCFSNHVQRMYIQRTMWATCFHQYFPLRGDNSHKYSESAMRRVKDKIFLITKSFNLVQLVDFLGTRLEQYYERRLQDVANERVDLAITSRYLPINDWNLPACSIKQLTDKEYEVPSQESPGVTYHVDMQACICSCYIGVKGGPCKHQHMVAKHFFISDINTSPSNNPSLRKLCFKVAMGSAIDNSWFSPTQSGPRDSTLMSEMVTSELSSTCVPTIDDDDEDQSMETEHEDAKDDQLDAHIDNFAKTLKEKKKNHPQLFTGPIQAFFRNFNKIETDSDLISALSSFGKYSGVNCSRYCQSSNPLVKIIHVQPTAFAHRKTLLGGRRILPVAGPLKKIKLM